MPRLFPPEEFAYYDRSDYGFLDYHLLQLLKFLEEHEEDELVEFVLKQLENAHTTSLTTVEDIRRFKNLAIQREINTNEFIALELLGTIFFFYLIDCEHPQLRVIKNTIGFLYACHPKFKQIYLRDWPEFFS